MEYDLANKLKDAGFPQGGTGQWTLPPDSIVARYTDRVYVPTLSELIEACAADFEKLQKIDKETERQDLAGSGFVRLRVWCHGRRSGCASVAHTKSEIIASRDPFG